MNRPRAARLTARRLRYGEHRIFARALSPRALAGRSENPAQYSLHGMKHIAGVAVAICLVVVTPALAATPPAHRRPTAGTRSELKAVRLRPAGDSVRIVFVVQAPIHYVSTRTAPPA